MGYAVVIRAIITVLCGVGLYASIFMLRKSFRAASGALDEPSVVEQPQARLFGGIPNSAIGIVFYALIGIGVWVAGAPWQYTALFIATVLAGATSVYLAYSLLFITRMPCKFCFTSHAVNALLVLGTGYLFKISYWH